MATSGSITTSKYSGRYYKLAWERTSYSVANNTSTIKWTLSCHGGSASWYAERTLEAVINGTTVFSKTSRKERYTGTIDTGTMTIKHNSDGTKSFSLSLKAAVYTSSVNCTGSGKHTLTAIPRAATLSSATNFTDESNPTITYSNAAGNSVDSLLAYIYAKDDKTILVDGKTLTKTGTSFTFDLTTAEITKLRNACGNAKTATVKFYIKTTIGGTAYWSSAIDKTFSIVNAEPTITCSAYDSNPVAVALTGNSATIIKGFNAVYVAMQSTAKKGGTIVNEYITNNGKIHDITSGTITNVVNGSFSFYAEDNRGFTKTTTITLPMINYTPLTCNVSGRITLDEADSSKAKLTFTISGNYWNGVFGKSANYLEISYSVVDETGTSMYFGGGYKTDIDGTINGNSYSKTIDLTDLDYRKSYKVIATVSDAIHKNLKSESKTFRAIPIFDWGEEDFCFNVPVHLANGKQIMGTTTDGDPIILSSLNTSNQMFFGYGGYDAGIGTSYFDGNAVNIRSKGNISNTAAGTIGGNKAWTNSSDARLKANISEIPQVYADIWLELTPRIFEWNELNYGDGKKQFGLIAQEAIEVFNKYGVNYEDLDFISTVSIDGVDYFAITYEHYHILTAHVLRNTINELVLLKQKVQELTS